MLEFTYNLYGTEIMKKICFLILSVLFFNMLLTGCEKKQEDLYSSIIKRDKLIVGIKNDAPPFGFINKAGVIDGFDADLAKYITKSLLGDESKVEFVPVTAANRIMMLNSRKVDIVIATMSITEKRQEIVNFSKPYYVAGLAFLVPSQSDVKSAEGLRNKKIITVFGSTAEKNLRLIVPDAKLVGYKTYPSAIEALRGGYADAMSADDTILLGIISSNCGLKLLQKRYTKEPYAVAFRKDSDSSYLEERIDEIIERCRVSGELERIRRKWISGVK